MHIATKATIGATLLTASVAAELVLHVQDPDGDVTRPVLFATYLAAFSLGAVLLTRALAEARRAFRRDVASSTRGHRVGSALALAGAGLLAGFGFVMLGSLLVTGAPAGASFVFFGLGLLAWAAGGLTLAVSLRRTAGRQVRWSSAVAGLGALVAVLVFADPWHDLGLFAAFAGWAVFVRSFGHRTEVDLAQKDAVARAA